jgi:hypothetical protein
LLRAEIVPAVRLDTIFPADVKIDLIKIDVERYEFKALRGLENTLWRWTPVIISKFSPTFMEQNEGEAYLSFLVGLGYHISVLLRDGTVLMCGFDIGKVMQQHVASGVDHIDLLLQCKKEPPLGLRAVSFAKKIASFLSRPINAAQSFR